MNCREESRPIGQAARPAMPPDLLARIAGACRQEIATQKSRRRMRWLAAAAATASAAVALLAVGLLCVPHGKDNVSEDGGWCFVQGNPGNCRQGTLTAGTIPDGVVWTRSIPGTPGRLKPLSYRGLVIVNAEPKTNMFRGGGRLMAYTTDSGAVRWEREFSSGDFFKATGFPDRCIRGGRLYLADGTHCLVLDAATGRDIAVLEPPGDVTGWKYLSATGDRLYGTSADGRTAFSVETATGREVWSRKLDGAAFVPALAEERLLLHTDDGTLLALNASSGEELWRSTASAPPGRASLHARSGKGVVLAESGEIMVFSASSGEAIWKKKLSEPVLSSLAMSDDAIYLQGGNRALSLADGFTIWYQDPKTSTGCSPPTVLGRGLLASPGTDHGRLAILSSAGQVLGTVDQAAEGSCDGAIVSGGRIITVGGGHLLAVRCRSRG
jgi:outer membrane protein assembly factor BamB